MTYTVYINKKMHPIWNPNKKLLAEIETYKWMPKKDFDHFMEMKILVEKLTNDYISSALQFKDEQQVLSLVSKTIKEMTIRCLPPYNSLKIHNELFYTIEYNGIIEVENGCACLIPKQLLVIPY